MFQKIDMFLAENIFIGKLITTTFKIALIIIISMIAKRIITNFAMRYLDKKGTQQSMTLKGVVQSAIKYIVLLFATTAILDQFGVSLTSLLAVAGIGSVAIGFGAQSLVKDIITGSFILFENQFGVGDYVELQGKSGQVEEIGLRTTLIRNTLNNEQYIIPNSEISIVTNKTKDFQRAVVNFELPYEIKLEPILKVLEAALEAKLDNDPRVLDKPIVSGTTAFNESGVNVRITCDTINGQVWSVQSDIRKTVKITLDNENVDMPYTTRTINVNSNIKNNL